MHSVFARSMAGFGRVRGESNFCRRGMRRMIPRHVGTSIRDLPWLKFLQKALAPPALIQSKSRESSAKLRLVPENHRLPTFSPQPPRHGLDEQPGGDTPHAADSLLLSSLSRPLPSTSSCFIGLCACSSRTLFEAPFPSSFINNNIYTTSTQQSPTASSPRAPPPEIKRPQRTKTRRP